MSLSFRRPFLAARRNRRLAMSVGTAAAMLTGLWLSIPVIGQAVLMTTPLCSRSEARLITNNPRVKTVLGNSITLKGGSLETLLSETCDGRVVMETFSTVEEAGSNTDNFRSVLANVLGEALLKQGVFFVIEEDIPQLYENSLPLTRLTF
jgi:hypothetical protein